MGYSSWTLKKNKIGKASCAGCKLDFAMLTEIVGNWAGQEWFLSCP
jgi:hypothetical protein